MRIFSLLFLTSVVAFAQSPSPSPSAMLLLQPAFCRALTVGMNSSPARMALATALCPAIQTKLPAEAAPFVEYFRRARLSDWDGYAWPFDRAQWLELDEAEAWEMELRAKAGDPVDPPDFPDASVVFDSVEVAGAPFLSFLLRVNPCLEGSMTETVRAILQKSFDSNFPRFMDLLVSVERADAKNRGSAKDTCSLKMKVEKDGYPVVRGAFASLLGDGEDMAPELRRRIRNYKTSHKAPELALFYEAAEAPVSK